MNKDILELDLEKHFILTIIEKISIIPKWREKELFNEKMNNIISFNWNLYREIKNKPIETYEKDESGWRDLKYSSNFSFSYLIVFFEVKSVFNLFLIPITFIKLKTRYS